MFFFALNIFQTQIIWQKCKVRLDRKQKSDLVNSKCWIYTKRFRFVHLRQISEGCIVHDCCFMFPLISFDRIVFLLYLCILNYVPHNCSLSSSLSCIVLFSSTMQWQKTIFHSKVCFFLIFFIYFDKSVDRSEQKLLKKEKNTKVASCFPHYQIKVVGENANSTSWLRRLHVYCSGYVHILRSYVITF